MLKLVCLNPDRPKALHFASGWTAVMENSFASKHEYQNNSYKYLIKYKLEISKHHFFSFLIRISGSNQRLQSF